MELKITVLRDEFIEIEVLKEDPAILDSLAEILQNIEGVEYAGYMIEHPLTMKLILRVKTNPAKITAREALQKALNELLNISNVLLEKVYQI
ncbi:MAG: RpoL/Rpb11 RNA polymerase subunit family protein [Nitrososphaerota archaeon]|nr:hypothetical protein [Candidatus Geocrenenecus dongiae]